MIRECIKTLLVKKYDGYKIYLHNFAGFDSTKIIKELFKLGKVTQIQSNVKLIYVKLQYRKITLEFYASYQILPHSFKDLALTFNEATDQKGQLDHNSIKK